MKNIELKSFRRTEGYKNMRAENRDKELSCYNYLFRGMSLAVICFMLLFSSIGAVSASVTYDAGTNTIYLENGTNTLASIYSEIANPSVLSYNSGTNTYTLSAYITGKTNKDADLLLENASLIFNNTATNKYYIKTYSDLTIRNMTIEPVNFSSPWKIWSYQDLTSYSINITNSNFGGGQIQCRPKGYNPPSKPALVKNNRFYDFTINDANNDYALKFCYTAAKDAYIYNNTFENINITGSRNPGAAVLQVFDSRNVTIDKIYFSNCSVDPAFRGMIHFVGGTDGSTVSNFEIRDCVGSGVTGKEYWNVTYTNGIIKNVSEDGIHLNLEPRYGHTTFRINNVTFDGVGDSAICDNCYEGITVDIYNVIINNTHRAFYRSHYSDNDSIFYITNAKVINYTTLYDVRSAEIRSYELADIYVEDTKGNPVENAIVTIEAVNPDVSDCVINHKLESLTHTVSLSEGHTPLPIEDEAKTVRLLSRRVTQSTDKTYTYTITAEKDGYNATVTVAPDESWYREDPNTYPKAGNGTVIITLPLTTAPSLNITNINATSITSNSAAITWQTDEEADTKVTYTTNPSTFGTHWQNDSLRTTTHSILLSELYIDTTYYFMVYNTDAAGNTANSTVSNFTTSAVLPDNATTVVIQSPNNVTDNRLRDAIPDAVLGNSDFIDVGRINTEGNYRDVIWFNLSQLNSTDTIKTAKLSLFWYYVTGTRNTSTTVEIYRPVDWAENYVTWNNRTNGVAWDNLGGDWYDRTNVAQGNTPYATVTFPVGDADNVYHEFDVTELVQSYVDGTYENTGFFIKANEVSNSYIAFRSSDWTNASERPKLVVSYGGGDSQQNTLSGTVTSPDSTTGIADANVTLTTPEGIEIDTVQADSTGHYEFTTVLPGDYNINATKHGYWPDSNPVTVNASEPATANIVLCQKGDFNTNSESADAGDLAMMADATVNATLRDVTYDLDGDGNPADAADLTLLKDVSVGVAELE